MQVKSWTFIREYIQDEVHGAMPDPQVLLNLLSCTSQKHQNYSQIIYERKMLYFLSLLKRKEDAVLPLRLMILLLVALMLIRTHLKNKTWT